MRTRVLAVTLVGLLGLGLGCYRGDINVDVPGGERRAKVDSTQIPPTANHEEARMELQKAYDYIRRLENDNAKLRKDKEELKDEKERYKDLYEKARKGSRHDD